MRPLDEAWAQFESNAKASIHVTKSGAYKATPENNQLAAQLGLVEAALRHIVVINDRTYTPGDTAELIGSIRRAIVDPNPENLRDVSKSVDHLFFMAVATQGRLLGSTLLLDAMSALGWTGKALLYVRADSLRLANDAARNSLDAIIRILVLTGHSSEHARQLADRLKS